jgi:glycosyltransferase involved in cell wall biosynthesis
MPAWNAEATIRESVESALAQTVPDLEVVVVDDGSRQPVAEVLADIRDPRLRILRHERNRGASAARNTALAAARSPLVSQLDADDRWAPEYLESILPSFHDPAVGLAYANAAATGSERHPVLIRDASPHPVDRFPALAGANPIPALTATMRTEAVRGVGGYARWLRGCEDYHLYLKLAKAGWRFAYVDRILATYRWPSPVSGQSYDNRRLLRNNLKLWIAFALRHPVTPGASGQIRSLLRALT